VFEFQLAVYFTQKKTFGILPLSLSPVFVQRTSSELAHAHVGRTTSICQWMSNTRLSLKKLSQRTSVCRVGRCLGIVPK
jgi:hypothetical protein